MILRLWSCRWIALRLSVALFITFVLAMDAPARLARLQVGALPGFDYAAEVNARRVQGRYGEAEMVANAGRNDPDAAHAHDSLRLALRTPARARQFHPPPQGRRQGRAHRRGDTLESILGRCRVRFLPCRRPPRHRHRRGKQLLDGESDEIILLLSVAGVFTTLAPEIDWAPSIFKVARRTGAMSDRLAQWLRTSVRAGRSDDVARACGDVATISRAAGPGAAVRLVALADTPDDLARLARFTANNPTGAFALRTTGREGFDVIKAAGETGEKLVLKLARKGPAARAVLASPAGRALLRPHPLLGIAKALWKGNAEQLILRALDRIDPNAWWALPLAAAWAVVEFALLVARLGPRKTPQTANPARAA